MGHGSRRAIYEQLFSAEPEGAKAPADYITGRNLVKNYALISAYLNAALSSPHKLETFVFYFLRRLVIVNLDVEQIDVPMVFEVINDRGAPLHPFEILKGKLLGQIDKLEVDSFNDIWERELRALEAQEVVDDFFRTYLRGRFASTAKDAKKFDGDYHRVILDEPYNTTLKLKENPLGVKEFINGDLCYYANLFGRLLALGEQPQTEQPYVYFNAKLTDMGTQLILISAACSRNDRQQEEKIRLVSHLLDRTYVLLQLNKSYDSNGFSELVFKLASEIRGARLEDYQTIFESNLLFAISDKRQTVVISPFEYKYFKEVGYQDLNRTFLRYLFARVEGFLCHGIGRQMKDSYANFVRNTGPVNGYHIEHVLAQNSENLGWFDGDEEIFERERNRLGALLLLKGRDNESSGNERYADKLKTYVSTQVWNESLLPDFYKSKLDTREFLAREGLAFQAIPDRFDATAVESRSLLLFELVKRIWH
jgi:hypothetical protein